MQIVVGVGEKGKREIDSPFIILFRIIISFPRNNFWSDVQEITSHQFHLISLKSSLFSRLPQCTSSIFLIFLLLHPLSQLLVSSLKISTSFGKLKEWNLFHFYFLANVYCDAGKWFKMVEISMKMRRGELSTKIKRDFLLFSFSDGTHAWVLCL